MEFIINTKTFVKYMTLVGKIALKNAKQDGDSGMIKLYAYPKLLEIETEGQLSRITVKIRQSQGYEYGSMGRVRVFAKELLPALKSIPLTEELYVCIRDGMLKLSPASDDHDYIKIPRHPYPEELPPPSIQYDQVSTVDREYFLKGLQQVQYACNDNCFELYQCIRFESNNNTLKFVAGSGCYFTIVEYAGNKAVVATNDIVALLPIENISTIIKIFKNETSSNLDIKIYLGDRTAGVPMRQIIESDNIIVCIYGGELFSQYPDSNRVLDHTYTYQIPTKLQDWEYIAEALTASKHSCTESVHLVKLVTDLVQGHIDIQSNTHLKMNRKVPFEPEICMYDLTKEKTYKPWVCCNAYHFINMAKKNKKKNTVTMHFEDKPTLDSAPRNEIYKRVVLFKFADETDQNGIVEKSSVFIGISTDWDDRYISHERESIAFRAEILDV